MLWNFAYCINSISEIHLTFSDWLAASNNDSSYELNRYTFYTSVSIV